MSPDDLYRLISEAEDLPDGPAQVALMKEAVRLADAHLDVDCQFFVRLWLIRAAFCGGSPDEMLVAISWCLGVFDQYEDASNRFDYQSLLWQCKHAISYSSSYAEISYEQYCGLLNDVLKRYRQFDASPRSVYMITMSGEFFMGHHDRAINCYHLSQKSPHDEFAEGKPWEMYFEIEFLFETDQEDAAMARMAPVLENPQQAEDVYPWFVYHGLIPLIKAKRWDEAVDHQRRAYHQVGSNPKFTNQIGHHIIVLTLMRNFSVATKMFERHFEQALKSPTTASRLFFFVGAWFLLDQLQKDGRKHLSLRLPQEMHPLGIDDQYEVARLIDWLDQDIRLWEQKFNERNGNSHITKVINDIKSYEQWIADEPVGPLK